MILYRLRCNDDHEFEGWFRNADAFETQRESGMLACPACGTADVTKALMAPSIAKGRGVAISAPSDVQAMHPAAQKAAELKDKLRAVRQMVEQNCDYVGDRFAEEARKIHYGEADAHGIYGETTSEESERLKDEGIEFGSVPWIRDDA